jgi:hypothetical protein
VLRRSKGAVPVGQGSYHRFQKTFLNLFGSLGKKVDFCPPNSAAGGRGIVKKKGSGCGELKDTEKGLSFRSAGQRRANRKERKNKKNIFAFRFGEAKKDNDLCTPKQKEGDLA